MSLFPAYGDNSESVPSSNITTISADVDESSASCASAEKRVLNSSDEAELLRSDPAEDSSDKDRVSDKKHKKSKRRKKSKSRDKSKEKASKKTSKTECFSSLDEFYLDNKIDYGNLRVSTLYNPARPQYDRIKTMLGDCKFTYSKKHKQKVDRYFTMKIAQNDNQNSTNGIKLNFSMKSKNTDEYIGIEDSGISWGDDRIDKDLVDKTAYFNKYLIDNPYDIDMWLQFVKFQEDRLAFDVFNHRVASRTTAKNLCVAKQLSILDSALKHNFNSMELLCKKVKLSEQSMANDQYLNMLKQLISTPELQLGLLNSAWFWYLDSVQCSMALCSVPSVKEMYAAAIKALSKAHRMNYPVSHVDIIYRLGLFLRQAGLWEQLWMLIKLNIETNLAASNSKGSSDFETVVSKLDLKALMDEENKIICSGLPTHVIWCRIESIRSRLQWLPSTEESDDPQRIVFSTDFADFIKPVSQKTNMFTLTVNILRLLKIPLLPSSHELCVALKANGHSIEWENDNIETCIPFLYLMIGNSEKFDNLKLKILSNIFKDFADQPNYMNLNSDYFKFVNNIMMQCSTWFEGDEQTLILMWWIRFLRTMLVIKSFDSSQNDTLKQSISSFRKNIKDILKLHRENVYIYKEFSIFETYFSDSQKGLNIMETCLQTLPCERNPLRIHLTRSLVEMIVQNNSKTDKDLGKCVSILISLTLVESSVPNSYDYDEDAVDLALNEYMKDTTLFLSKISNFDKEITLIEHMMPDSNSDWICCHGWLIYLTQPFKLLQNFYRKIIAATYVEKADRKSFDSKRKLQIRENFLQWYIVTMKSNVRIHSEVPHDQPLEKALQQGLKEFPLNTTIVWYYIEWYNLRSIGHLHLVKLFKEDDLSQPFALAFVIQNFIQLYKKYDPSYVDLWQPSHGNRLLNLLQTVSSHPALKKCALIWRMLIEYVSCHTQESAEVSKKFLYQALDECPWNKSLYQIGCTRIPSEFSELVDIMVEKQIRLHAMPEELQPL